MILRVGVTESLSAGDVGTWTSSKTLDFTSREYSSSYEGRFHTTNHWDGSGTDIIVTKNKNHWHYSYINTTKG